MKQDLADGEQASVLSHLPDSWDDLKGSLAGPMHERNWALTCVETFKLEPFIVAVGPPEKPYALAPLARDDHRHAVLVGGGDRLLVADGAARLDDGDGARLGRLVDAVAEPQGAGI